MGSIAKIGLTPTTQGKLGWNDHIDDREYEGCSWGSKRSMGLDRFPWMTTTACSILLEVVVDLLSYESPQLPGSKSARTLSYQKPRTSSSPSLGRQGSEPSAHLRYDLWLRGFHVSRVRDYLRSWSTTNISWSLGRGRNINSDGRVSWLLRNIPDE
jgi:hypothetical protein